MKFKQTQKFRVIVNGVSVYTTAKQIRWQFGDQISTNAAVTYALTTLEALNDTENTIGLSTRHNGVEVQISIM